VYADADMKNWNTLAVKADSQFLSPQPPDFHVAVALVVFWHFFTIVLFISLFLLLARKEVVKIKHSTFTSPQKHQIECHD